jgi:hypothetical protein
MVRKAADGGDSRMSTIAYTATREGHRLQIRYADRGAHCSTPRFRLSPRPDSL